MNGPSVIESFRQHIVPRTSLRFWKFTALFTLIHGAVFTTCFTIAFSRGMDRFDHPVVPETYVERLCTLATSVLIQPYGVIAGIIRFPRWLDWIAVFLNSLLWGTLFALIFRVRPKNSGQRGQ